MNHCCPSLPWFAVVIVVMAPPLVRLATSQERPLAQIGDPDHQRVQYWERLLSAKPQGVGPAISDRAAWREIATRKEFRSVIAEAERLSKSPFPSLPDELFLEYSRTGRREACEQRIDERMHYFTTCVYAECLENKGRFLPAIEQALVGFDQQKTWLFPAHDPGLENFRGQHTEISICSSALAWNVATAAWWLGDALSPDARRLVVDNLERRIFAPFEELVKSGKPRMRWLLNTANHNSVSLAGIAGCAMAQIESLPRRAYFAAASEKFIQNYLAGFTRDGYCAEGVGYWNYGFGRYLMLAETLRRASGGRVDWLADDHVRTIARFGRRSEIMNRLYPTYSDSFPNEKADALLMAYLSRRYGWGLRDWEREGTELSRQRQENLFEFEIFSSELGLESGTDSATHSRLPLRDYFPDGGLLTCRPLGERRDALAVSIKGGHNAEPHNHNDLGSFSVVAGNQVLLVDPGAEVYTSRTFTSRRYKSNVLNSFGHSVPRVASRLQSSGRTARARITTAEFTDERDTLRMDLSSAYDVKDLKLLERTFVYSRNGDGTLTVVDEVAFDQPQPFETAMITFSPWTMEAGNRFRIGEGESAVVIDVVVEGSNFRVTSFRIDEELPDHRFPIRLAIELTRPVVAAKVTTTIRTGRVLKE